MDDADTGAPGAPAIDRFNERFVADLHRKMEEALISDGSGNTDCLGGLPCLDLLKYND